MRKFVVCFAVATMAALLLPAGGENAGGSAVEMEKEEISWFEAGIDLDLMSAYVWRNAIQNDELVFQPCVWADFTRLEWCYIGGNVWQNWNMTGSQDSFKPRAMNETDFNVHIGSDVWTSDDEEYTLTFELGNDFFTYRQIEDCPNSYELYLKATFDNPFVGVYGQYSQAYEPVSACYFEIGLNKEVNLGEALESENDVLNRLTFGADWNVSMGSGKYFSNYLIGFLPGDYDPEIDDYGDDRVMSNGIGGTTLKGTCAYQVCDHFALGFVVGFTALLSDEGCDAAVYNYEGNMYRRLLWCGVQAKFDF